VTLALPSLNLPETHASRQNVYEFLRQLALDRPAFYARTFSFPQGTQPIAARVRERMARTLRDALPLTPTRKTQIADALQMTGTRRELLEQHGLLLADNNVSLPPALTILDHVLDTVPASLHNLGFVTVADYLGTTSVPISFQGVGGGVNIFGLPVGCCPENGFPGDVPAFDTDTYSIAWCHELNHVVDAFTVQRTPSLDTRHQALLDFAGTTDLQYLRSNVGGAFFQAAPQEFFASMSNQWFANTRRTLELAITRFHAGYSGPINQWLFFAGVYAQGGSFSHEYQITTTGAFTHATFPVTRDGQGRIVGVAIGANAWSFTLDVNGNVTAINAGVACDTIDFNNDGVLPDSADIDDLLSVFGGGACSTNSCGDLDFNNDGVSPDSADIEAFLRVFGGGAC
jgi:hypothetical protein